MAGAAGPTAHGVLHARHADPAGERRAVGPGGLPALWGVPRLLLSLRRTRVQAAPGSRARSRQSHRSLLHRPAAAGPSSPLRASPEPGHADGDLPEVLMRTSSPSPVRSIEAQAWSALLAPPDSWRTLGRAL